MWPAKNPWAKRHHGLMMDIIVYPSDALGRLVNPFRKTAYKRSEIFPLTRIEFEGSEFLAPNDPSAYIARRYGDYMTIPPPEARKTKCADPVTPCKHPESWRYPRGPWRRWLRR